jgi:RimJ/RimL family protein N-acetyltransferase
MFEIDTERLDIRPLSECDETLYCDLFTDADTMRYIGPPMSPDRAVRSFHKAVALTRGRPAQRLFFSVAVRSAQRKIGICSIQQIDPIRRRAEAGIVLKSFARAQGFSREILPALVGQALATLPVDEVWTQYAADHSKAERLVVAAGLSRCFAPEAYGEGPDKRVWSAHRNSWGQSVSANRRGDEDVKFHGISRENGAGRAASLCHEQRAGAGADPGTD